MPEQALRYLDVKGRRDLDIFPNLVNRPIYAARIIRGSSMDWSPTLLLLLCTLTD